MKDIATNAGSRLITVRLDAPIRVRLDDLAATSDRTISQLARYALTAYFDSAIVPESAPTEESAPERKHVSLRLPTALAATLDEYSQRHKVTASDALRQALSWWLAKADPAHLGMPGAASEVSA